jgi:hypothetical protein
MNTLLSRRGFLMGTTAGLITAGLSSRPRIGLAAICEKADDFGGFPIGVQSYSLRNFDTREVVRHIHGLGLHYAEFYSKHLPLDADEALMQETLRLLAEADIRLVAHGVNSFSQDHQANRKIFEFAKRAGIRNLTADPQPDSFDSLDRLCEEFDIRICIHNHGPSHAITKSRTSPMPCVIGIRISARASIRGILFAALKIRESRLRAAWQSVCVARQGSK